MSSLISIAHLSDVHLSPVTGLSPRHWNAKRALGYLNWTTKRRHVHKRSIVDRIIADMKRQQPDHIALTGDLVNLGLPAEYDAASRWLASVGTPADVSLVPGNHDIYTRLGRDPGVGRWRAYMASDEWGAGMGATRHGTPGGVGFPYVRRVGPVAIIGMCSAVETAPGIATGHVGADQIADTRRILDRLSAQPVLKLVLIHHPPHPGLTRARHELLDAGKLSALLVDAGADLALHGHTHLPTAITLPRSGRPLHIVGVASASAGASRRLEPLAQYNLLRIAGKPGDWRITLERRGLADPAGDVTALTREVLE